MMSIERLNPGSGRICRGCRCWLERAWNNGHPNPCALVRWEGPRHLSPELVRDADGSQRCDAFAPAEAAAAVAPRPGAAAIAAG